MANRPISFEFVADVSKYLREVKKIDTSTDDILEALTAVSNSGEDLERKLGKAMRDAATDVEVLERAVKNIPDATETAADEAGRDFHRIGDDAREAGAEAADEFKQNLGAGLASGGSMFDVVAESAGALIGNLKGQAGIAAAAVMGIGLVVGTTIQKNAEAVKETIEELASMMEGLYTQGVVTASKTQQLADASKWIQDNAEFLEGYRDEVDHVGISMEEFAAAAALGGRPLDNLRTKLQEVERTSSKPAEKLAASNLIGYLDDVSEEAGNLSGKMDLTAGATKLLADHLGLADRNMDGVVNEADQLYVNLDKAVEEAAAVGTGNTALDALLQKADELGWDALTAKEKADLIGSDNTALAGLASAAAAVEEDTRLTKGNLENLADPGLPNTKADAKEISRTLKEIPKDIEVRVAYSAQTGGAISGSYTQGYGVSGGSSTYGSSPRSGGGGQQ